MAKIIIILLVLAPLGMAAASMDCPGVPSLDASSACGESCDTKLFDDLCIQVMLWGGLDMSHKEGGTRYVTLAAQFAVEAFDKTRLVFREHIGQTMISGDERAAYEGCLDDYAAARGSIARIHGDMLPYCRFAGVADELARGVTSLETCENRPPLKSTPLYDLVRDDRYKLHLIHLLAAKLLGI